MPLEHPSIFTAMRPSSSWEQPPARARAGEHASTYYCMPSYCTAVLPPGLPRRQDLRWEGACRCAYGSAGLPRSPWCSRPKLTMDSNHLGKIQKSPVSFGENPAPRKPRQRWPGRPCNISTAQPRNWDVVECGRVRHRGAAQKLRDRREKEKHCLFIDFSSTVPYL